ncbi:MAG TPA: cupredoxin domain-containing protein [Amycolatopsis sp.]|uniref:iron transporter n=1 Tax=Amycolatopsis sp. TaxID=37632 RepID=UPI002F3E9073
MRPKTVFSLLGIGSASLVLVACGGEPASPQAAAIHVEASDTACDVASTTAAAGSIAFEIANKGNQVTEFYLYGKDGRVISEVENIGPGTSRSMTAQVTEPGTYTTACKPGMRGEGIRREFTVTAAGGAAAAPAIPQGVVSQYTVLEQEIKDAGGQTTVGPWRIGYIVEAAEPWYHDENGHQHFRPAAPGETHHIEIIPIEAATGRIVPDVPIHVDVLDAAGNVVEGKALNFYYAEFFHYASNFSIPRAGTYTLRAKLRPPTFLRHGEETEQPALSTGAEATFTGVELKTEG